MICFHENAVMKISSFFCKHFLFSWKKRNEEAPCSGHFLIRMKSGLIPSSVTKVVLFNEKKLLKEISISQWQ